MADYRELFTPRAVATVWNESPYNQDGYMGTYLFPSRKKIGLDLAWIKGTMGLPVSLMPSAFDAQATYRDRPGLELTETQMPFFREAMRVKEKDRQDIIMLRNSADIRASAAVQRFFDDANNLLRGARVVRERMVNQLLFPESGNAGISIKANGIDYTYNYDPNGTWKANNYTALTGNDKWDAPTTADPFAVIETVKRGVRARTGVEPTVAIMNSTTFALMRKIDAIKNRYLTVNNVSLAYLTDAEVKKIVEQTTGTTILLNDKQFKDESQTTKSFVPDNYVALIPNADGTRPLGNLWMSATPEEIDLVNESAAEVSIVDTGVAITRTITTHPVNINVYASMICLPSFERMDECALIKVA